MAGMDLDAPTVLVVASDSELREAIRDALSRDHDVRLAPNLEVASSQLADGAPDAVVVDREAWLAPLRERTAAKAIPIVALVDKHDDARRASVLRAGASDYVLLPLLDEELRARVSHLLAARRTEERLRTANELKSTFLANMSHELRTPLNAILGFAQVMLDGRVAMTTSLHREFVGDILTSGRHLLQIVNDVLDLSKIEAGKMTFRPERVELDAVLGEVASILRAQAASKRIEVIVDVSPACRVVQTDPARLRQVTYNYLANALRFSRDDGHVVMRATPEGDSFRLEVEDDGVGIRAEDLERLFVEFQQVHAGLGQQGTGLGLALTRRLVEAQGGSVGVRSRVGQGSVFHAILPLRGPES